MSTLRFRPSYPAYYFAALCTLIMCLKWIDNPEMYLVAVKKNANKMEVWKKFNHFTGTAENLFKALCDACS